MCFTTEEVLGCKGAEAPSVEAYSHTSITIDAQKHEKW